MVSLSAPSPALPPTSTHSESETPTLSILDRLRAPQPSDLTHKQRVDSLPPPKGKRRARGTQASDPKSVSLAQRLSEFPKEHLAVSNNTLFCKACREELALKKVVIANHVRSAKHEAGKKRLASKDAKERDIAEALVSSDQSFSDQQYRSLQDYIEASLMLQYNHH